MYSILKRFAKAIVPRRFLYKNEVFFRSLLAWGYRGTNHKCSICELSSNRFIPLEKKDLLCPYCGSRARTRRLIQLLEDRSLLEGNVLHFSPSRSLYRQLKANKEICYFSSDYEDEFIAQYKFDITNIDCEDNTFDLIICYHILEHIPEDQKAMKELYRVLKPEGICLIQTPFKEGTDIYEDATITSKEDRLIAFGQEDHVRIYSAIGLANRLKQNPFSEVTIEEFKENEYFGLQDEIVISVKKK